MFSMLRARLDLAVMANTQDYTLSWIQAMWEADRVSAMLCIHKTIHCKRSCRSDQTL